MAQVRSLLRYAGLLFGVLVYLWVAGVNYAGEARARKARRRRRAAS